MDAGEKSATAASSTTAAGSEYDGMPDSADEMTTGISELQSMTSLLGEGVDGVSCSVDGSCD